MSINKISKVYLELKVSHKLKIDLKERREHPKGKSICITSV